ncbi:MAG: hypothetical protein Ct9H300mP27_12650 [Chloroflexota bacterium]|nr:MAG: hypothetical protein Ct9H300mP27_12650 [Chloroflexota bacterium]
MGHPFGATGIRMIHETVTQLRQEAGDRQVNGRHGSPSSGPKIGLAQCSGAGDVQQSIYYLNKTSNNNQGITYA